MNKIVTVWTCDVTVWTCDVTVWTCDVTERTCWDLVVLANYCIPFVCLFCSPV